MLFYPPARSGYPAYYSAQPIKPGFCPMPIANPPMASPAIAAMPLSQQGMANPGKRFELQLHAPEPLRPNQPGWLDLQVYDPLTGRPPANLQIVHEKPAHIFIVNRDFSDFQHVHPEAMRPGWLRVPVNFKSPGHYKLFLQFTTPEQGEQTLGRPFRLGQSNEVLPPLKPMVVDDRQWKLVDGYAFRVSGLPTRQQPMGMPQVEVLKNGQPVGNIQPYLGAGAHGVILSEDGRSFIHTHPMAQPKNGFYQSPIGFHTHIAQPGLYKMWVQTQIDGQVHTVDWTFRV